MIELYSGTATLCSVAKQYGMSGSLALGKMRKRGAHSTIFVFDILNPKDRALLYHWLESPLLAWVHMAQVCGTCSKARQIKNGGPRALGSDDFPMGLPDLTAAEKQRVELANSMYWETCRLFGHCASQGILVTLETHPGVYSGKRFPINNCLMLMRFHSATLKCV